MAAQHAAAQAQQHHFQNMSSSHSTPQDVNLVINDHNAGLEVSERDGVQILTLNGHNNQVGIHEGVNIPCVLTNGHNNYIHSIGIAQQSIEHTQQYLQWSGPRHCSSELAQPAPQRL